VSRFLDLDPRQPADVTGFETMRLLLPLLEDVDRRAWRIMGGWMVRAYASTGTLTPRPTTDVDLSLFPSRGGRRLRELPTGLRDAGFRPDEEPSKLVLGSHRIDLLVPPGGSRAGRLGEQAVFEAKGTAFAFAMDPEALTLRLDGTSVEVVTARLSAALVAKAVLFSERRPKYRDDAVDVGLLLDAVRRDGQAPVEDLRAQAGRKDVRKAMRAIDVDFAGAGSAGVKCIRDARGLEEGLTAAANARRLLAAE